MSTTVPAPTPVDPEKLEAFMGSFVGDMGAIASAPCVILGDRLGLYRALAEGPATAADLAQRTGCDERYLQEWLSGQAAGGYVTYDGDGRFSLTPEQSLCLAQEDSPAYIGGAFQLAYALFQDLDRIQQAFKSGDGVGWHEHHHELFCGTERFFRPGYVANIVESWIPALEGVEAKLLSGGRVADIGCGHGASSIILAQAFPRAEITGFDYHEASIEAARESAQRAGVSDRVRFEVAPASAFPGEGNDLVCMFDCLHDMGDPVGAARHVLQTLDADGTWMLVEPMAGDTIEENLNPVGRIFYSASTQICTPASRAQEVGLCLGAQAGQKRLSEVLGEAGFTRVRRAAETPFNLVLEVRP
jgi:2-polyprenyl-3-methyl-5-hydroxy-6-metoxy-1,4-benzoquinol methylase